MMKSPIDNKPVKASSATQTSVARSKLPVILAVVIGGASQAGTKAENQDAFAALQPSVAERESKGIVVAIADGVSSASHAAQAAQLSVTQFIQEYYATTASWSTNKWVCY